MKHLGNWLERRSLCVALASALALALALVVAGCGGSSGSTGSSGGSTGSGAETTASGGNADAIVGEAEQFLADHGSGVGGPLPKKSVDVAPEKTVWILSCTMAASGCAEGAEAAKEAVELVGWKANLVDGEADPSKFASTVEQAQVAGATALISISVDCGTVRQALAHVRQSGLIVENITGLGCSDPTQGGGEELFTHTVEPEKGVQSWAKLFETTGELQANWALANVPGSKEAIVFKITDEANGGYIHAGFERAFQCPECSVAGTVPLTLADLGSPITQKTQTALVKYPDANIVDAVNDPFAEAAAQAIVNAGKTDSVANLGFLASPQNIELIRGDRGQSMSIAWAAGWTAWAAVDDVIRLVNGEQPVYSGWSQGIVDAEHLPEGETYEAPVDWKSNYEKLWGIGG